MISDLKRSSWRIIPEGAPFALGSLCGFVGKALLEEQVISKGFVVFKRKKVF